MNPRRVTLENVRTFPDLGLSLPEGLVALAGENGSGKSTILTAIEAALFADGSRDLAPMLGPYGDVLKIELEFEHAGDLYRVRRQYKRTATGGTAWLNFDRRVSEGTSQVIEGAFWDAGLTRETTKATQAHIEQTLGLSRVTSAASWYLGQGNTAGLTEASPAERKGWLGEAIDPRKFWPRMAELAREDARQINSQLIAAVTRLDERRTILDDAPQVAEDKHVVELRVRDADAALTAAGAALEQARERHAANQAAAERIAALTAKRDAAKAEHDRAVSDSKRLYDEACAGQLQARREVERAARAVEDANRALETAMTAKRNAEERLSHLEKAADGAEHCDRCRQILGADARREAIASLQTEVGALVLRVGENMSLADLAEIEQAQAIAAFEAIAVPDAPEPVDPALTEAVREAKQALAAVTFGSEDQAAIRTEVDRAEGKVAVTRHQKEQATHDLIRLRQQAEQLAAVAEEARALETTIAKLQAELDIAKLAERAYGRDGIPVLLLGNIIPAIEAETNRLLELMPTADGTTFRVALVTQREQRTVDHLKETLDILVHDQDGARPYETFSGGEQARLNACLRLALAAMLADRRGAESRVLCLDEIEYLDALGQGQLVDVVRAVAGRFDTVLVVSHSPALRDAFDTTIEVVKRDGVSRVVSADVREPVAA